MKFWKVSPGDNAHIWPECQKNGYIAVGWDDIEDIMRYPDRDSFNKKFELHYPNKRSASLWNYRLITVGDIIIANDGLSAVVGIGVVTGGYISPSIPSNPRKHCDEDYHHVYPVKWLYCGHINIGLNIIPTCCPLATKDPRLKAVLIEAGLTEADLIKKSNEAIVQDNINYRYKVVLSGSLRNVVLQGPPGTGKTYEAKELAARLLSFPNTSDTDFLAAQNKTWNIVQFHPAYQYDDFVHGVKIDSTKGSIVYEDKPGIFKQLCERAEKEPDNKFILIVDEINRAHLASVLGELIYGLEYRGEPIQLTDGSHLTVPQNLYIIGTMNTADRSVGHIDYAVRRRFAFISVLPEENVVAFYHQPNSNCLKTAALSLFRAVAALFHEPEPALSADFHADDVQPGHTYFFAIDSVELKNKFLYQVAPLLREYVKDGVLKSEGKLSSSNATLSLCDLSDAKKIEDWLTQVLPDCEALGQDDDASSEESNQGINQLERDTYLEEPQLES